MVESEVEQTQMEMQCDAHWRQSALNSAGALQGGDGEFFTINFRGGHKSGGARATVASPSLAPLPILYRRK